ncbi:PIG-L family deacetylase [Serinibacter arcticus]|uniref:PIG-L family deacetylase n=1 Tax=Serinibacter arcticus TaxID=1655435 RepID=A0A2U1ZTQ3_9MICO|nr:PIG-L deacetylase family protein [Serinibacter arcticus]PWD50364.1 PIG-L family deacetylase [Serinibacter arcticus]
MAVSAVGACVALAMLVYLVVSEREVGRSSPDQRSDDRGRRRVRLVILAAYAAILTAYVVLVARHVRDPHPHTVGEIVDAGVLVVLTGLVGLVLHHGFRAAPRRDEPRRVLVVGAHPDDLELACGGTVASLARRGHEVKVLVMSRGTRGGDPAARREEAVAGARMLGTTDVTVHDFPDTFLADANGAMIEVIEAAITAFRPGTILTHSEHDQHQDHQAVHRAVLRAGRQAHSILCFESPSVTRSFSPSVFVDISDFVDLKIRAVQTHRDQSGKPYMTASRVKGIAAFRGAQAKVPAAEGFEPVRYLQNVKEFIG